MNNREFNEQRYNRKKQLYRFSLGLQQLIYYPFINLIWIIVILGFKYLVIVERMLFSNLVVYPVLSEIFSFCIKIISIIIPLISVIGIVQLIGFIFAIKDEADMSIVFGAKRDVKNQPPILIYKKKDRRTGVTKREFYSAIPMERWKENKDAIADRLNIHFIGDISYGGRKRNKGNQIYFESAQGRTQTERGILYDEIS